MMAEHALPAERTPAKGRATAKLHRTVGVGLAWAYAASFADKAVALLVSAVLARLLVPEAFGLIATILVWLSVVDLLRELGFKDSLVYLDENAALRDTMFWFNLSVGAVLTAVTMALAPVLAHLAGSDEAASAIRWMGLTFLFGSFGATHEALLHKRLAFARRYYGDFVATVVKGMVSIGLVLAGHGVTGLAIGFAAGSAARAASRWVLLDWRPGLDISWPEFSRLFVFGRGIAAKSVIDVAVGSVNQIAIAIILGQAALGFFYMGSRVPEMAVIGVSLIGSRILFPVLATMRSDRTRLRASTLVGLELVSLYIIPLIVGTAAVADLLTIQLFGTAWSASAPILAILTLAWGIDAITWPIGEGLKAAGRPGLLARINGAKLVVMSLLTILGIVVLDDPVGAAWGNLVALAVNGVVLVRAARPVLDLTGAEAIARLRPALVAAGLMLLTVVAVRHGLAGAAPALVLAACIAAGVVSYAAALAVIERRRVRSLLHIALQARG